MASSTSRDVSYVLKPASRGGWANHVGCKDHPSNFLRVHSESQRRKRTEDSPAPGNISDSVATTTQHQERDIEALDIFNTFPVRSNKRSGWIQECDSRYHLNARQRDWELNVLYVVLGSITHSGIFLCVTACVDVCESSCVLMPACVCWGCLHVCAYVQSGQKISSVVLKVPSTSFYFLFFGLKLPN